ncbi:glycosyltransferase family 4 protein (plasmid) [Kitasatospora sp. NBC_00070]|uniref:glycosyltransferase family 4 protein n=1 Tax=Kitasatospora sp. NBC_00070 TaxID=2975962 RepID=UPI002F918732
MNTANLRVLFVCHYYPPHLGGIENVVRHEAVGLAEQGAHVTVVTSGKQSSTTTQDGVTVVRIAAWNGAERHLGVPFPLFSPRLLPAMMGWARWADVVHVHDSLYMTSWAALAATARTTTPYLLTQHIGLVQHPSPLVRGVQRAIYATAGRLLVRRARRVFTLNASVAKLTARLGARAENSVHLPNGVHTDLFRPAVSPAERRLARSYFGLPPDRPLALFAGRLVPKKGYALLLEARRADPDPRYDLVFAGEGGGSAALVGRSGVHFLGPLPPTLLAEAYRACDMFALPSRAEGFPLTVQEAMASGLAVLTTDDPGYAPYRLDARQARLLPRTAPAWTRALAELAADPRTRRLMSIEARRYALAEFGWPAHLSALLHAYRAVLPAPAGQHHSTGAQTGTAPNTHEGPDGAQKEHGSS